MALLWFEGFEGLGVTEGPTNRANITDELERKFNVVFENEGARPFLRPGDLQGKALSLQNNNTFTNTAISYGFPNDMTDVEFVLGWRWKASSLFTSGSSDFLILWHEEVGGTPQIRLRLNFTNHTMELFRGNTSLAVSGNDAWAADTWMQVELKIKCSDGTAGSYEVRVDGSAVLGPTSSVDTLQTNTLGVHLMQWNATDAAGDDTPAKETMIDDIYLLDTTGSVNNNFLGVNAIVVARFPNAEGTTNQFTPSVGTDNSANVDENPASTTDYNDGATSGHIDEYSYTDVAQNTIHGVMLDTHVTVDVQGGMRTYRHRARSGATIGNGSDIGITDNVQKHEIWEVDPNTSALWTKSNLNAAEFGVEVRD